MAVEAEVVVGAVEVVAVVGVVGVVAEEAVAEAQAVRKWCIV